MNSETNSHRGNNKTKQELKNTLQQNVNVDDFETYMEKLIEWLEELERQEVEKKIDTLSMIIKDEENPSNKKKENKKAIKEAGLSDLYLEYIENPLKKCKSTEDIEHYVDSDLYTYFFWEKNGKHLTKFISIVRYRILGDRDFRGNSSHWQTYNANIGNKL